MDVLEKTLSDLAVSFSLPALSFGGKGAAVLSIQGLGEACFERWRDGGLAVTVYRPAGLGRCRAALDLCAPSANHPWPVSAVFSGQDSMGFMMRIPASAATVVEIERALNHISGMFRTLEGNS